MEIFVEKEVLITTLHNLAKYGNLFQIKVIGALLTQRLFLLNIFDSLDAEYFENSAHKWIIDYIITYFNKWHTNPTIETLSIETKKIENEVLRLSITECLREAYSLVEASDLKWVEGEFANFCRNQQIKKAISNSVSLLEIGDYDGIKQLMNNALKAGEEKNIGHEYDKDIESRYREDDRKAVPFPWPVFNSLTQGGYGSGDLVLIFGNPKGGKSWAVAAMGAYAATLGYNVLHYSLELGAGYVGKRYDAIFTGIPVDKLDENREKVESVVSNIKGKIIIKEYPPRTATFDTIESHLQQLEHQNEFKPDLIIIDYLDYVKTRSRVDRKSEIDDVYVHAKRLAKQLEIPIISPSQANRTGAKENILESSHAAGSYDKIMIADILISLARGRKDRINGTGRWHIMGNRYGPDGLTFASKIDTSNGHIEIYAKPLDDDEDESMSAPVSPYSNINEEDREYLKNKFLK